MIQLHDLSRRPRRGRYVGWVIAAVLLAIGLMLVFEKLRNLEAPESPDLASLPAAAVESFELGDWGRAYPAQYDGYRRPVDSERSRHGGSDGIRVPVGETNSNEKIARYNTLFLGYPFWIDQRTHRGHAFQRLDLPQADGSTIAATQTPSAVCSTCHGTAETAAISVGDAAQAGACADCHVPKTMALRVRRPGFVAALQALAKTEVALPQLPSIEAWRRGDRDEDYDPNLHASRQEMRSLVCAQCHLDYYADAEAPYVAFPLERGLQAEQLEADYDERTIEDWKHPDTGSSLIKAQHPSFELWSQGVHAESGVSCADCHMPYKHDGAFKVSEHRLFSPMLNVRRACQGCHLGEEAQLRRQVDGIQGRTSVLIKRAEDAVLASVGAITFASQAGVSDEALEAARRLHRKAQWRLDFVMAESSLGFHAPQEAARILAEAIDYGRQGELAARTLLSQGEDATTEARVPDMDSENMDSDSDPIDRTPTRPTRTEPRRVKAPR